MEEKKTKPPDKTTDYFKSVKIPLKHVLKNPDINLPKITDAVIRCNKIVINTLMFIKLYLLDYFEKNSKLPEIDKEDNNVRMWERWVGNNIIIKISHHTISKPGKHIVKFWMVNPGVVLQKLVIDFGGVMPSYLGPPETKWE